MGGKWDQESLASGRRDLAIGWTSRIGRSSIEILLSRISSLFNMASAPQRKQEELRLKQKTL